MGAPAGDEEEGKGEADDSFAAGTSRQASNHLTAVGSDREGQPTFRSRRLTSDNLVAQASMLQQERRRSVQIFQSDIANEKSFCHALAGVELEDVRPNTTQIEPRLQLPWPFLLRLKVNTFAVPLGLSSQAQLWGALSHSELVASALGVEIPSVVQWAFWVLALGLLIVIALGYFCKAMLYWGAVKREWAHPIRSNFFFTPFLASLTLVAGVPLPISRALHPGTLVPLPAFLFLGAIVLCLEMASYGKWLFNRTRGLSRANPSYQLAVVGNFLVARLGTQVSGGSALEIACGEISLFFFAVGILYLLLVFFAIQHHSANNIVQPSSATSVSSAAPRSETPDAVSTRGERRGSGTSATVHSRRQQSTLQDHHYNHNKTISAAVLPRPGRRPPEMSATIVEDDGDTPVSTATSSCVLRAGREELESEVDGAPSARGVGQSEASNIAARSPSFSESRNGRVPGQPQQHLLSPGRERQDSVAGSRRVSVGGNISEDRAPEAAVIAPASRTAGAVTSRQTSASTTATEAVDERAVLSTTLHPIYFLFVAPPSAASLAWKEISGEFDMLARSLYFIAGFLYLFLALGNSSFLRTASFSIAWWAYSFPSSTFAGATILYAEELSSEGVVLAGLALGLASTVLVLVVFARTVSSAIAGTLFGPDPVLCVLLEGGRAA